MGGSYTGTVARFALSQWDSRIQDISARNWVLVRCLGRGMPTSLVSNTEKALFTERKPLSQAAGDSALCKLQRDVDEVRDSGVQKEGLIVI